MFQGFQRLKRPINYLLWRRETFFTKLGKVTPENKVAPRDLMSDILKRAKIVPQQQKHIFLLELKSRKGIRTSSRSLYHISV